MPRPKRADEAGAIYHALNRGNGRRTIFEKPGDFDAFERILPDGLDRYPCQILSYCLMSTHWHLVLRPSEDGGMSHFVRWITLTHTQRLHAHRDTSGDGHVYQGRFKSFPVQDDGHYLTLCRYVERNALRAGVVDRAEDWRWGSLYRWCQGVEPQRRLLSPWPIRRPPGWVRRVNTPPGEKELEAVRRCVNRGSPMGDEGWVESTARRLDLEMTLRARGRPKRKPVESLRGARKTDGSQKES